MGWKHMFISSRKKVTAISFFQGTPPPKKTEKSSTRGGGFFGPKNIDFSKIIQYAPKSVSRGIFFQNFRFLALENSKSSFWVCKLPKADMVIFLEIFIFVTFLVPFWPLRAQKIDFSIIPQNKQIWVSRGILRRNLFFLSLKIQKKSF